MKVKYTRKTFVGAVLLIGLVISFAKCNPDNERRKLSKDASALAKFINLNIQYSTARWEIFGFPDHSEAPLAMGPTDDIMLIAELAPMSLEAFQSIPPGEMAHIKVGSAKPWLPHELKTILETGESSTFDLSVDSNCRPMKATLRKSNREVSGILCKSGEKAVALLFLSVET